MPVAPIVTYEYEDGTPWDPNNCQTNVNKPKQKQTKSLKCQNKKNNVSDTNTNKIITSVEPLIEPIKERKFEQLQQSTRINIQQDRDREKDSEIYNISLKKQLEAKDKEINQLKKLVNDLKIVSVKQNNILEENEQNEENDNNDKNATKNVSFSQIYTVLDSDPSLKHQFKRTVEKASLLRHNRPGTPHPHPKTRENKCLTPIKGGKIDQYEKVNFAKISDNDQTPRDYTKLQNALTPCISKPKGNICTLDSKSNQQNKQNKQNKQHKENELNRGTNGTSETSIASVVSDLDGVLKATQRIHNTMSRLSQS